ncbi:multiheme c-type cytochrome [Paraglaciecola sp. MB-3u-78]|uniref:multiheme c-type cytochrome n=1 Tax=Paraglaciecola sp. MB-3u-78 TaxID=2058332 RepID=UPI000C32F643|nr:multiheme c-type cytochrome [Paraglaciecola sp. MB-3u-78]PKG96193.1 hypothetical protein CXF95_24940 [Paraglaciecola sp. MB-3u-78]
MLRLGFLLLSCIFLTACSEQKPLEALPQTLKLNEFVGSETCGQCHQMEFNAWQGTHHQLAMGEATTDSVLGNFDNVSVNIGDRSARFFEQKNRFHVTTDNGQGNNETFVISDTFGIDPIQQYLITFDDGRKQVLDFSWDTRPVSEGGQRWMIPNINHDSSGEPITSEFHWTSSAYNWNSRCASCHTTGYKKQYDVSSNTYNSQFSEINVSCEACHGQGLQHVNWAEGKTPLGADVNKGFDQIIKDSGRWQYVQDNLERSGKGQALHFEMAPNTKTRQNKLAHQQVDVCAKCHSRRMQFSDSYSTELFTDKYLPMLIEPALYHSDGQIKDEVFVWGSFKQSKMAMAGVTCSNCHDSHSLKLKVQGNGLCTQCHESSEYDLPKHHHHPVKSEGAQCVNCHMPANMYMSIDPRRDHSFKIPTPGLSAQVDAPNACNNCHQKETVDWADTHLLNWFGKHSKSLLPRFSQVMEDKNTNTLIEIASDLSHAPIVRGSALIRIDQHSQESLKAIANALKEESELIRLGAIRRLDTLPPQLRLKLLEPHLDEASNAVKLEMARVLSPLNLQQLPTQLANKIHVLFEFFITAISYNADTPENQLVLGDFYFAQGQHQASLKAYRHALKLEPHNEHGLLNLADLYRALGRDSESESLLKMAIQSHPNSASAHYAMGLYFIRTQSFNDALIHLQLSTRLLPNNPVYIYAYVLTLKTTGKISEAHSLLEQWMVTHDPDAQLLQLKNSF